MNRTYLAFLCVALCAVGLAGYLLLRHFKTETGTHTGKTEKIRIANIGEYSLLNLIAKEKGFFTKNGLDAEIVEFDSGATSMAALLSGKADIAIAADFVGTRNLFTDPRLRILSAVSHQQVFEIVARKDKGISSADALKGKAIGVTRKTHGEFFLGTFLRFHNLNLGDVTVRDLPPGEIVAGVENGTLDAGVTYGPFVFDLKRLLGDNSFSLTVQGDQDAFALAYSTEGFISTHEEQLPRYLRALAEAEKYLSGNQAEARQVLERKFGYDKNYLAYEWPRIHFGLFLDQALLLSMEDQSRWLIENKLVSATRAPNFLPYIYIDALESVKPDVVTIIH